MIAYDSRTPRQPPRRLSEQVRDQLAQSLLAEWGAPAGARDRLEHAVAAAALEAAERGLQPEELIIDLKSLESTVLGMDVTGGEQRRFHDWLVGACLKAFYRV